MAKINRALVLIFLTLLFSFKTIYAQEGGFLDLIIRDQNNDRILAAAIALINKKNGGVINVADNNLSVSNLTVGTYVLKITSPGFKLFQKDIRIASGRNALEIQLELEGVKANVNVESDKREKLIEDSFSRFMTDEEISRLPESGEEIRDELERRYGKDIAFKINGSLDGSRIPPRDQILSIKVIRNAFDAEFDKLTGTIIDIRTKSVSKFFGGHFYSRFSDSRLNARNPFDAERQRKQNKDLSLAVIVPLKGNKSSLFLSTFLSDNFDTQRFVGFDPTLLLEKRRKIKNRVTNNSVTFSQILPGDHFIRIGYSNYLSRRSGLGVFDFPERRTIQRNGENVLSVFESGVFKKKFVSDFRFTLREESNATVPSSNATAFIVLNAFSMGGASTNTTSDVLASTFGNNLLFDVRKHALKFGTDVGYKNLNLTDQSNLNGSFLFSSIEDFTNNRPSLFSKTTGISKVALNQVKTAFYAQDYFKLNKTLYLSLGLRYEWQNDVRDSNNFSPRLGFAWSPEKSGNLVVRGGAGIFYESLSILTRSSVLSDDGSQRRNIIILNPEFSDSTNGTFPTSFSILDERLIAPKIYIGQVAFAFKLGSKSRFEGAFTHKRGLNHFRSRDINFPVNGVRPNSQFARIRLFESSGSSTEDSFNLKYNQSLMGLDFFTNYTLARRVDNFSDMFTLPTVNLNINADFGPSNTDQRHKVEISTGIKLTGRLMLVPAFRLESGLPYNITTGRDNNGDGVFNDRPSGVTRNSARGEFIREADLTLNWRLPARLDFFKGMSLSANLQNLLNTTNFTSYTGVQTSPFFRQPNRASLPRTLNLGLSFSF